MEHSARDWLAQSERVKRLALRLLRDRDLAEDVAQDVMVATLQRPNPAHSPFAWMFAATRNLSLRAQLRDRRRRDREQAAARPEASADAVRTSERLRAHRMLNEALQSLPEPYRTAVVLRYLDDVPPREIAIRTGVSPATARKHVQRGLERLRDELARRGEKRDDWFRAVFAGLGGTTPPTLGLWLVEALAMSGKKLAVAAVVLAMAGSVWWVQRDPTPRNGAEMATSQAATVMEVQPTEVATPPVNAEPSREPAAMLAPAVCRLEVLDPEAVPVVDAAVYLLGESDLRDRGRTDEQGRMTLPPPDSDEPLRWLVVSAGAAPQAFDYAPAEDLRQVLQLENTDSRVAGIVTVDGQAPGRPILLTLKRGGRWSALEGIPTALRSRLFADPPDLTVECDPEGHFEFVVDRDFYGSLRVPSVYWVAIGAEHFDEVDGPTDSRHVALTRMTTVSGRIVDEDGRPVGVNDVLVYVEFADRDNSPSMGVAVGEDGRFEVGVHPGSSDSREVWRDPTRRIPMEVIKVWVRPPGSADYTGFEFQADDLATPGDVGDLVVGPSETRELVLEVTDEFGAPIAGARTRPAARDVSSEDGRITLDVLAGLDVIHVGAPGFHRTQIPVPPESTDGPIPVELAAGCELEFAITDATGAPAQGVEVHVESTGKILGLYESGQETGLLHDLAGRWVGGSYSHSTQLMGLRLELDPDGTTRLSDVNPGIPFEVTVRGAMDRLVAQREQPALEPGEWRTIEIQLDEPPFGFRGQVIDVAGRPLVNARVTLHLGGSTRTDTDRAGRFHIAHLYGVAGGSARLTVQKGGYVTRTVTPVAMERGMTPVTVMLEQGRDVRLEVRTEDRELFGEARVTAKLDGTDLQIRQNGVGRYELADLPEGVLQFHFRHANRDFQLDHDTTEPIARMVLPTPGRIVWVGHVPIDEESSWLMARIVDAAGELEREVHPWVVDGELREKPTWILPGRYTVEVQIASDDSTSEYRAPVEIEIRPGEVTEVDLTR